MSWQAYIDTSLVGSGHIQKGAIISLAGDSKWAGSEGFELAADEMKAIANIFQDDSAKDAAYGNGLRLAGEQYAVIKVDEDSILLRNKVKDHEKIGACIGKATQCIVIGYYDGAKVQAGNANQTVQALADYLKKSGY